jgi:hypothetical protein
MISIAYESPAKVVKYPSNKDQRTSANVHVLLLS